VRKEEWGKKIELFFASTTSSQVAIVFLTQLPGFPGVSNSVSKFRQVSKLSQIKPFNPQLDKKARQKIVFLYIYMVILDHSSHH